MTGQSKRAAAACASGVLFGAGLALSGMTDPHKVLGFLDVFGRWDASLLCVMVGAIGVHALSYRLIRRRAAPLFARGFALPTRRDLDAKLLIGAAIFGVGWGLGGYCPGPSLVALPSLGLGVALFVAAMGLGTFITGKLEQTFEARRALPPAQPSAAE
jgi:uncharacterized protein